MEYRKLGKSGLMVSPVCIGTMTFGQQIDESEAVRLTRMAVERGVNFIDTANIYVYGESEKIVGKAVEGIRDDVIIATKAGDTIGKGPLDKGLSRSSVMRELDRSLKRLNTDYVDIYYMHMPDWVTDIEEALETYTEIVRSGKARYIGMSNFPSWGVCEALWKAETKGLCKPIVTQMVYNQITRSIDVEFVPFVKAHDIGLVTYNPLAGGILTGKYKREEKPTTGRFSVERLGTMYTNRYWKDNCFDAVEKLAGIAADAGMTPAEFATRWVISNPHVTSVLVGFTKESQLLQNMESIEKGPLPADLLEKCDAIWQDYSGNQFLHIRY